MHDMKEEVNLRILGQESLKSELRLKNMFRSSSRAKLEFWKSFRDIFVNTDYLEGFGVKTQGYKCNLEKIQGSRCKMVGWF
jgi:hypothetical protein